MKILIVSDTHGNQERMKEIIQKEKPFEVLVHAGDMEDSIGGVLGYTDYSIRIVSGNCDYGYGYPKEDFFRLGDKKVLLTHGYLCRGIHFNPLNGIEPLADYARYRGADILIYGHTHIPDIREMDGLMIINPGSLSLPRQENHKKSYAVFTIEEGKTSCEIRYIDE